MTSIDVQQTFESAVEQQQAGRLGEAEALCRQALAQNADHAGASHLLGVVAYQLGRFDEALRLIDRAIAINPESAAYHINRGIVLQAMGRSDDALAASQIALTLQPGSAEAFNNIGNALRTKGMLNEAAAAYVQALTSKPQNTDALNNLGATLTDLGKLDQAIEIFRRAIALRPSFPEALNNLGNALRLRGALDEAVNCYGQAIVLNSQYAEAYNNLAVVLKAKGQFDEALTCYRKALTLKPNYPQACNNLGNALLDSGHLDDALTCFGEAVRLLPTFAAAHSSYVFSLHFHPDYEPSAILGELSKWHRQHAQPLRSLIPQPDNDRSPDRALNIGYVSPDFRDHCQILFTLPLLRNHDRQQFRIFCYSDVSSPDAMTELLRPHVDQWRNIVGMNDANVAQMIQNDRIDVLVDLTMHMADNRQLLFARKPAPVQVSWLAYPGSTGQDAIDYRLTDPNLDPPGLFDGCYSEKSIRLPDTFWCFDPMPAGRQGPEVGPLPAMKNGYVTYGCLNNFCKINDQTLDLWAPVLAAVPDAKLMLLAPSGLTRTELLEKLQQRNIAPERVELIDRQPRDKYLELYNRIDIGLDTFPYNGHTTSLDSFWMGVPVVTLVGQTVVGRAGWSQLSNLGLKDLAARTPAHFARIAARVAANLPRLEEIRSTLRGRMQSSPLMDAPRFARNIETAYRQMWRQWCQPPK